MSKEPISPTSSTLDVSKIALDSLIQKLRSEIPLNSSRFTDSYLLKFLKARKFNYDATKDFLRIHLEWLKEFQVDAMCEEIFKAMPEETAIRTYYPQGYHGVDLKGRPIYIERLSNLKVKELLCEVPKEKFFEFWVREAEKTRIYRLPRSGSTQTLSILDVNGISVSFLKKDVREMVLRVLKLAGDNYPETMGQLFIVNAPASFGMVWSILKPFIDPVSRKKITVLGKNFQEKLKEVVNLDFLPGFLGGNCTQCGPDGCLSKDFGPWNDPKREDLIDFISVVDDEEDRCTFRTPESENRDVLNNSSGSRLPRTNKKSRKWLLLKCGCNNFN
jgi:CRAL/TRIO domain